MPVRERRGNDPIRIMAHDFLFNLHFLHIEKPDFAKYLEDETIYKKTFNVLNIFVVTKNVNFLKMWS
jgi:hypothetical protein